MKNKLIQATYIGPIAHLKGKTAIIRPGHSEGTTLAQFDDMALTVPVGDGCNRLLGFGWAEFDGRHFDKRWTTAPVRAICRGTECSCLNGEVGTVVFDGNDIQFTFTERDTVMNVPGGPNVPIAKGQSIRFSTDQITPELLER